jgi:hypothetical protein
VKGVAKWAKRTACLFDCCVNPENLALSDDASRIKGEWTCESHRQYVKKRVMVFQVTKQ